MNQPRSCFSITFKEDASSWYPITVAEVLKEYCLRSKEKRPYRLTFRSNPPRSTAAIVLVRRCAVSPQLNQIWFGD